MKRAQLAKQIGVHTETLRYYERQGVIPEPDRTPSGHRIYTQLDVERIRFIKRAQELGFSLKEIAELLALRVDEESTCADVQERAMLKIHDIEEKIRDLKKIRSVLSHLAETCTGQGSVSNCPILDALGNHSSLK